MNHGGTEGTEKIVGAAIEVRRHLGPGLLEACLKLTGIKLGLLINFKVPLLKQGIKRLVN